MPKCLHRHHPFRPKEVFLNSHANAAAERDLGLYFANRLCSQEQLPHVEEGREGILSKVAEVMVVRISGPERCVGSTYEVALANHTMGISQQNPLCML